MNEKDKKVNDFEGYSAEEKKVFEKWYPKVTFTEWPNNRWVPHSKPSNEDLDLCHKAEQLETDKAELTQDIKRFCVECKTVIGMYCEPRSKAKCPFNKYEFWKEGS